VSLISAHSSFDDCRQQQGKEVTSSMHVESVSNVFISSLTHSCKAIGLAMANVANASAAVLGTESVCVGMGKDATHVQAL